MRGNLLREKKREQDIEQALKDMEDAMERLCKLTNHERVEGALHWLQSKNTAKRILS